jgi:hypothetical protein
MVIRGFFLERTLRGQERPVVKQKSYATAGVDNVYYC